jgi:nucleotidyltransferase AbiEii toxin of type IV toxin-antitoxin system
MSFAHEDPEFQQLLAIVARDTGIAEALIEKDYWVTHAMWALHETGVDIWFKGGTSLSKGFGLIQRFSEDLDLMILPGAATGLPEVTNWTSANKGPVAQRQAFYDVLADRLIVPGVRIERDRTRIDRRARGADYLCHYPCLRLGQLAPAISPFVRLEVGHARVMPSVRMPLSSFVHDYLEAEGMLGVYHDNRPSSVRCVHPLVTLFEKLDAMARRYERDPIEADSFLRHYEDAAHIIRSVEELPAIEMSPVELAYDMVTKKDIRALPSADEPALQLADPARRKVAETAYNEIAPMFWGDRIDLDEACAEIRSWVDGQEWW